jgi:hypothetical protein
MNALNLNLDKQSLHLSRRQLVTGLAALGIIGPAALDAGAQAKASTEVLEGASILLGEHFSPETLQMISTALDRNLEEFESLRLFSVPDSIEPAPVFLPLRYDEHPPVEMNIGAIQQGLKEDAHG